MCLRQKRQSTPLPRRVRMTAALRGRAGARAMPEARRDRVASAVLPSRCAQVAAHASKDSCYIRLDNMIFDVTPYLKQHPGGELLLLRMAGADNRAQVEGPYGEPLREKERGGDTRTVICLGTHPAGRSRR